jgi:hypothetical protein
MMLCSDSIAVETASNKQIEFLFPEDNNLSQSIDQFDATTKTSSLLREDKWLNASPTRLDIVLMNMQSELRKEHWSSYAREIIKKHFERPNDKLWQPAVNFSVRYQERTGRLLIVANFSIYSKPKKPMKEFCRAAMQMLNFAFDVPPNGIRWKNVALNILLRDSNIEYDSVVTKLANSALFSVTVDSSYQANGREEFFELQCKRQQAGGPIEYVRYSKIISIPPNGQPPH